jgi:methyltransferase (TIGR00027 family)
MFNEAVSKTALLTAAARAEESARPDPLFLDPFAKELAGSGGHRLLLSFGELLGAVVAVRTRFFDESICGAIADGVRQVVVLGAGLDTRPYRLPCLSSEVLWLEVDFASVLDYKRGILKSEMPRCTLQSVALDIRDPGLIARLVEAGLEVDLRTLWIIEGVFHYLEEREVGEILDELRTGSSQGSEIVFNASNKAVLEDSRFAKQWRDLLEGLGTAWRFTTEAPEELLSEHGFVDNEVIFVGHTKAHYGRLRWPPTGSPAKGAPVEWLARGYVGAR